MQVRLQKFMAEAGLGSRRANEAMIRSGRVTVNGRVADQLGTKVDPQHDRVVMDGKPVRAKRKIYVALHKPRGLVCSKNDELGRPTIYELLPKEWRHLHSVGRLDFNSEGLLFLTNDGEFSLRLTHPRYGVRKTYVATVDGPVAPPMAEQMTRGIHFEGERYKAEKVRIISTNASRSVVELELAEGKYREVRCLFEAQARTVRKLQRTRIGKIRLGELPPGKWRTLTEAEIKSLLSKI